MPAPFAIRPSRLQAAALVLLLHASFLGLMLRAVMPPPYPASLPSVQLRLHANPSPPPAQPTRRTTAPDLVIWEHWGQFGEPKLPAAPVDLDGPATPAEPGLSPPEPVRPLDLRLPAPLRAPGAAPSLHERIRADARANSPRESAEQRMANALGARGWTVTELADGGRKITGPFGECVISRESMMIAIDPGNPRWEGLPEKLFGCGGIEKGSLKHERPK